MRNFFFILLAVALTGCGHAVEAVKKVWGSSTQTLERERANAIRKSYSCSLDECFNAVKALTAPPTAQETNVEELADTNNPPVGTFQTFIENRAKNILVVVGVPGNIDTTEVGIFFNPVKTDLTSIEISSLSSSAKRKVSEMIDLVLETKYPSP